MSAEQTPDIERVLAEHESLLGSDDYTSCICAAETINLGGLRAHVAQALAPVLAAAVRDAKAEVLREAAHEYLNSGLVPNSQHRHYVSHWIRDRADRVAEPQHEAATSGKESEASDE